MSSTEMTDRNARIFDLIHRERKSVSDVARLLDISRQRVSQIYRRECAIRKVKRDAPGKKLFDLKTSGFAITAEAKEAIDDLTKGDWTYSDLMRQALDEFLEREHPSYTP